MSGRPPPVPWRTGPAGLGQRTTVSPTALAGDPGSCHQVADGRVHPGLIGYGRVVVWGMRRRERVRVGASARVGNIGRRRLWVRRRGLQAAGRPTLHRAVATWVGHRPRRRPAVPSASAPRRILSARRTPARPARCSPGHRTGAGSWQWLGGPAGSWAARIAAAPTQTAHRLVPRQFWNGVPLRDVQETAPHADPGTTVRYDRARGSLDRHATYIVAAYLAGAAR